MSDTDQNTQAGDGEDSPVIQILRQQIKDLQKELKARPTRDALEAELAAQAQRKSAAEALLIELGAPAGMAGLVTEKVEDVTAENVVKFLEGLGLATREVSEDTEQSEVKVVSELAQQVAASAGDTSSKDLAAKIRDAKNFQELNAVMVEAGLAG